MHHLLSPNPNGVRLPCCTSDLEPWGIDIFGNLELPKSMAWKVKGPWIAAKSGSGWNDCWLPWRRQKPVCKVSPQDHSTPRRGRPCPCLKAEGSIRANSLWDILLVELEKLPASCFRFQVLSEVERSLVELLSRMNRLERREKCLWS